MKRAESGLSLIETMIALAIGIVLLAAACQMFVGQVGAARRLLLATRVQQDLQLATDLVAKGLRRLNHVDPSHPPASWCLVGGAIQMKLGTGNWQSLTDADTMRVTRFDIVTDRAVWGMGFLCQPACPAPATNAGACPSVTITRFTVAVDAEAASDASVSRHTRQSVLQRNDEIAGACP